MLPELGRCAGAHQCAAHAVPGHSDGMGRLSRASAHADVGSRAGAVERLVLDESCASDYRQVVLQQRARVFPDLLRVARCDRGGPHRGDDRAQSSAWSAFQGVTYPTAARETEAESVKSTNV